MGLYDRDNAWANGVLLKKIHQNNNLQWKVGSYLEKISCIIMWWHYTRYFNDTKNLNIWKYDFFVYLKILRNIIWINPYNLGKN